jgi:hypothetical protein
MKNIALTIRVTRFASNPLRIFLPWCALRPLRENPAAFSRFKIFRAVLIACRVNGKRNSNRRPRAFFCDSLCLFVANSSAGFWITGWKACVTLRNAFPGFRLRPDGCRATAADEHPNPARNDQQLHDHRRSLGDRNRARVVGVFQSQSCVGGDVCVITKKSGSTY